MLWVFEIFLALMPFDSIFHARIFIPRYICPSIDMALNDIGPYNNSGIQRFSPWDTHQYGCLTCILVLITMAHPHASSLILILICLLASTRANL